MPTPEQRAAVRDGIARRFSLLRESAPSPQPQQLQLQLVPTRRHGRHLRRSKNKNAAAIPRTVTSRRGQVRPGEATAIGPYRDSDGYFRVRAPNRSRSWTFRLLDDAQRWADDLRAGCTGEPRRSPRIEKCRDCGVTWASDGTVKRLRVRCDDCWLRHFKAKGARLRARIIAGYGGKCACCGEGNQAFLELDHVANDGKAHRREIGPGSATYRWAVKNKFPPRLQLLCSNCNMAKARHGVCPHVWARKTAQDDAIPDDDP